MDYIVNPPDLSCPTPTPNAGASFTSAVTYDGASLGCIGATNGLNLNTVISNINAEVCSLRNQVFYLNDTTISNINIDIAQIQDDILNLTCSNINTSSISWSCVTPSSDTLCSALTAIEEKLCELETASANALCKDDGAGSGSSVHLYKKYEAKPYVQEAYSKFDLEGYGTSTWQWGQGASTDEDGCTQLTNAGTKDVSSEPVTANQWWWIRNKKGSGIKYYRTAIAAAEPADVADEVKLYRLETDGASQMSLSLDQREYKPYEETFFRSNRNIL
jgi:hypothetical protein